MKKESMPKDLKNYLEDYIEEYFFDTDMVITGISLGGIALRPGRGANLERPTIEVEDGWQFIQEDKNVKKEQKVIEIQEEVKIGEVILEKGDKIKVLTESSLDESKVEDAVGEANFYLISVLMDIYSNKDLFDYSSEIRQIEKITGKKIDNLFTFMIKQFSSKPSYKVSTEDYKVMSKELYDVTGKEFYTKKETDVLSQLYYG